MDIITAAYRIDHTLCTCIMALGNDDTDTNGVNYSIAETLRTAETSLGQVIDALETKGKPAKGVDPLPGLIERARALKAQYDAVPEGDGGPVGDAIFAAQFSAEAEISKTVATTLTGVLVQLDYFTREFEYALKGEKAPDALGMLTSIRKGVQHIGGAP